MPLEKITVWGYRCQRCDHTWVPRDTSDTALEPAVCPKCKSPYWNRPRKTAKTGRKGSRVVTGPKRTGH